MTAPTGLSRCQATIQGGPTTFGPSGGTGTLNVSLTRECAWTASTAVNWIELTSSREGQGQGSVSYRVLPNGEPVSRRAPITVGEQRVDVAQDAAPCQFDVSRPDDMIGADGAQLRIDIATHPVCRWSAASQAPWITLVPPSGTGPGTVQVSVALNPGATRSATVVVAGRSVTLTQAARPSAPPPNPPTPPPSCSYAVSPDSRTFGASGGTGSLTLNTGAGCTWLASGSAAWVVLAGSASGSGSANLSYAVLSNPSPSSREATLLVGGAVHRVVQNGAASGGVPVQLDGSVRDVTGVCPVLRFRIGNTAIVTTTETAYKRGNCSHVTNGVDVELEGRRQPDGTVVADTITLNR